MYAPLIHLYLLSLFRQHLCDLRHVQRNWRLPRLIQHDLPILCHFFLYHLFAVRLYLRNLFQNIRLHFRLPGLIHFEQWVDFIHEKLLNTRFLVYLDKIRDFLRRLFHVVGMRILQQLAFIERILLMRKTQNRLHRIQLNKRNRVSLQKLTFFRNCCVILVFRVFQ